MSITKSIRWVLFFYRIIETEIDAKITLLELEEL